MKRSQMATTLVIIWACHVLTGHAQSGPADQPVASAEKPNFTGTWVLNPDLSDTAAQVGFGSGAPGTSGGQRRGGGRMGGGFGGRGGFGGGFGGGRSGGGQRVQDTEKQREVIKALSDEVRYPSQTLLISHGDSNVAITDAQDHTRLFQINGKTDTHQVGSNTVDSKTRWDGTRLVTEYDLGNGRKLRYTYSIVQSTKQLLEQVAFEGDQSRSGRAAPPIRHVYDPTPATGRPKHQ